jgi:hypothetical protein
MTEERKTAIEILDILENILAEHDIMIPDDAREGADEEACIYGETYYLLEDNIVDIVTEYKNESIKENRGHWMKGFNIKYIYIIILILLVLYIIFQLNLFDSLMDTINRDMDKKVVFDILTN